MSNLEKMLKKILSPFVLAGIYLVGIIMEMLFANLGFSNTVSSKGNTAIMICFFIIVLAIFGYAFYQFRKGTSIKKVLMAAQKKMLDSECNIHKLREEFKGTLLEEPFEEFCKELDTVASVSKEAKVDIEEFVNYDFLEKTIHTHYLDQISGIMTGLGILGTFIGLSIGLNSFDLSGSANEVENKIQPLMDGIKVAFHTSIYGMAYSILYNLFYRAFYSDLEVIVDSFIESFTENVIQSVETGSNYTFIRYQEKMYSVMEQQTNILQTIENNLSERFIKNLSEHFEQIGSLTDNLVQINKELGNSIDSFAGFGKKIDDYQQSVNSSIECLKEQVSLNNKHMKEQLVEFKVFVEQNERAFQNYDKIEKEAQKKINDIINIQQDATNGIESATKELGASVGKLNQKIIENAKNTVDKYNNNLTNTVNRFADSADIMKRTTDDLPSTLKEASQNMENYFEKMQTMFGQYLEYADKLHRDITSKWELFKEYK